LLCRFFRWFALHFQEITYAKNSVFLTAFFGDLSLNEKQKKPFVLLNIEVTEALHLPPVVQTNTSFTFV